MILRTVEANREPHGMNPRFCNQNAVGLKIATRIPLGQIFENYPPEYRGANFAPNGILMTFVSGHLNFFSRSYAHMII